MKNSFFQKQLVALLVILSSTSCIFANNRQHYLSRGDMNCCLPIFECGCFNGELYGGVAPIVWTDKGCFQVVSCLIAGNNCTVPTSGPIVPIFELPKFSRMYHVPWTVGGRVGYSITDCSEVYFEVNYRQASSKCFTISPNINVGTFIAQTNFEFNQVSKYAFYDVYIGARTYRDLCWCDCLSGFLGIQVGLAHHRSVKANITTSSETNPCANPFTATCVGLFPKHTAVAAGANLGLEYYFGCNFALVLTAEFIATCGPNGNPDFCFNGCVADVVLPEIRPTNFIIGGIGTELLFPVTLGLKYSF